MNDQNNRDAVVDVLLQQCLSDAVPVEVEQRLRGRLAEFRERVAARPPHAAAGWLSLFIAPRRLAWAAGIGIAAMLVIAFIWVVKPADAWAEVAQAVQAKPWIHGSATGPDGMNLEWWFSSAQAVRAFRAGSVVLFADHHARLQFQYEPSDNVVYRLATDADGLKQQDFDQIDSVFQALTRGDATLRLPEGGAKLVEQRRRPVKEDGRDWIEYELTFRDSRRQPDTTITRFRVDPETRLPHSVTHEMQGLRQSLTFLLDYPETGPADVYDLGVPLTARVVNHVPDEDLARILEGGKRARQQFDPYFALIVGGWPDAHWSVAHNVYRVWRKDSRWRIERAFEVDLMNLRERVKSQPVVPGDAEPFDWWKQQMDNLRWIPLLVSDGQISYRYNVRFFNINEPGHESFEVESVQADYYRVDPQDPMPSLIVLPEFQTHPLMGIPSTDAESNVNATPTIGPPETVLVKVRRRDRASESIHTSRFWIDPVHDYMARRWELQAERGPDGQPRFQVWAVDELARSPKGRWYPTTIRDGFAAEPGGELTNPSVTRFYLDFQADMPDSLFAKPSEIDAIRQRRN